LQKNRVEKFFKQIDKKRKTDFFLDFFYHVFGRFSVKNCFDQPWYFFGLRGTNQPRRGPSGFFLVPLGRKQLATRPFSSSFSQLTLESHSSGPPRRRQRAGGHIASTHKKKRTKKSKKKQEETDE
jgi:hypothetical protein